MAYDATLNERKQVQYDILTYKLDIATNDKLVYKTSKIFNKGLNPDYFSGNNTKIVNILNDFYKNINTIDNTVGDVYKVFNPIILDTAIPENKAILDQMRAATGKDTLIESVLALAKGEIGGLAFLNPTDANDGHVVTFDKTLNKFVLKPAAGEIDQNLLLFENEEAKKDYLDTLICKIGQLGHLNGRYYKVVGTGSTKPTITEMANFEIKENKTLSIDSSISGADNMSLVDSATQFVVVVNDVKPNVNYTLVLDEELLVSVTPSRLDDTILSMGANSTATGGKINFTTADSTIKRLYFVVTPTANNGLNTVNAKVAAKIEDLEILAWEDLLSYTREKGTSIKVGGAEKGFVPNGTIESMLDKILYPVLEPTLEFVAAKNQQVVFEKNTTAQNIKFKLSFDKTSTSETITGYKLYRNGVLVDEQDIDGTSESIDITYFNDEQKTKPGLTVPFNNDSKFKVELKYGTDKVVASKEVEVVFVDPIYVGSASLITDDGINNELLIDGNKLVIKKSNIEATYTHENLISMIAYPETYGDLVEIKDQNGLDLTDCFKKKTIVKNSVNYTVYYFEIRNCLKNFKITFKFEA